MRSQLNKTEIEELFHMLEPKIQNSLRETSVKYREDLEQEIKLLILTIIHEKNFNDVPGFFEFIEEGDLPKFFELIKKEEF